MARRPVACRLLLGSARALLSVVALAWTSPACFSAGDGSGPPPDKFYYPVGLAVSSGGNVLYVVNSDFDLQWNGGTLQSYDLFMIRRHAAELIAANETGVAPMDALPFVTGYPSPETAAGAWNPCFGISNASPPTMSNGTRVFLSQGCAPPVDSSNPVYFKGSAVIGAFATDLQISHNGLRMFAPVRGNATVTWADLTPDDPTKAPTGDPSTPPTVKIAPFPFACGQGGAVTGSRCDATHQAGDDPDEPGDTRNATMPGEPFGIAQSQDGTAMAVTHQSTGETSLLLTGLGGSHPTSATCNPQTGVCNPSMQFVLEGMPTGGNGITAVPHDPFAVARCEDLHDQPPCVHQAFLQTSHLAAEVDLLRYFDDDGSSLHRSFLEKERAYPIVTNIPGTDSRGIVVDPTPTLVCQARLARLSPSEACVTGQLPSKACAACGQTFPSRVFIANRAPASIVYGHIGEVSSDGANVFDPDQLVLEGNVPLLPGPSRLYLAPIVDASGHYALRLFVVCYDTAAVFVFKPDDIAVLGAQAVPESVIYVGAGPFAMAFDPFTFEDVAAHEVDEEMPLTPPGNPVVVGSDPRQDQTLGLKTYRFGYLASFTNSYLQVIDLDDSRTTSTGAPNQQTFEQVVFTLGQLTSPKGT
jgi:hypothetical protein